MLRTPLGRLENIPPPHIATPDSASKPLPTQNACLAESARLPTPLVCARALETCTTPGADIGSQEWHAAEESLLRLGAYLYAVAAVALESLNSDPATTEAKEALYYEAEGFVSADPSIHAVPASTFAIVMEPYLRVQMERIVSSENK
jgi:hypothetical protein